MIATFEIGNRIKLQQSYIAQDDRNRAITVPLGTEGMVKSVEDEGKRLGVRFAGFPSYRLYVPASICYRIDGKRYVIENRE